MSLNYWLGNWGLKARTLACARERVVNWREAAGLRLNSGREEVRIMRLRNGMQLACRGGNLDWRAFSGLVLLGAYGRGLSHLAGLNGEPLVLDFGANAGFFSLLAAEAHPKAKIIAYEPAPPNLRMVEINRLLNPSHGQRIKVVAEAVGGVTRKCEFVYDDQQPEASGLAHGRGTAYPVVVRSFAEIVTALDQPVGFVKMDVEGAEFEILQHTPREVWERIAAITIELHASAEQPQSIKDFLQRMASYGFQAQPECEGEPTYFFSLSRQR